jgi:mannosyltransferase OCH1-like enzyme
MFIFEILFLLSLNKMQTRIVYHRGDVWRLQVLMNYGGFYFDNDVYVIQSLQKYRKYEMTLEWNHKSEGIGSQILIAHRNARLLKGKKL